MTGLMSGAGLERWENCQFIVTMCLNKFNFSRLVELSVCKKARLDSDSTLVAVITAVGFHFKPRIMIPNFIF